jgi:FkbM family methyltransferase
MLSIPRRIVRKSIGLLCKLIRIDNVTFQKICKNKNLIRIGSDYGGWVVDATQLNGSSVCYCVGCGEDITFDLGLIEKYGCKIFAFDPTPRAIKHVLESVCGVTGYYFHGYGVWDIDGVLEFFEPKISTHVSHSALNLQKTDKSFHGTVKSMASIMNEMGHAKLDLIKLDVEGAEYKIIDSMMECKIFAKILCVEFDEWINPLDMGYKERIRAAIYTLINNGYTLIHAEFNGNYTFLYQQH